MLFNYYINDLIIELKILSKKNVYFYADDIALICLTADILTKQILIIQQWGIYNHMNINYKKSGILQISPLQKRYYRELEHIKNIPIVQQYKYLGIIINNDIKPNDHLKYLKDKI